VDVGDGVQVAAFGPVGDERDLAAIRRELRLAVVPIPVGHFARRRTIDPDDPHVLATAVAQPALVRAVARAVVDANAILLVGRVLGVANDERQMATIRRPHELGAVIAKPRELPRLASRQIENEDIPRRSLPTLRNLATV